MKDVELLNEPFKTKVKQLLAKLAEKQIDYLISETLRTQATQSAYYAQGRLPLDEVNALRLKAGLWKISEAENKNKITWTMASKHLKGLAIDIVPARRVNGKLEFWWNAPRKVWEQIAVIAEANGMEWGGRWDTPDMPHYQK